MAVMMFSFEKFLCLVRSDTGAKPGNFRGVTLSKLKHVQEGFLSRATIFLAIGGSIRAMIFENRFLSGVNVI